MKDYDGFLPMASLAPPISGATRFAFAIGRANFNNLHLVNLLDCLFNLCLVRVRCDLERISVQSFRLICALLSHQRTNDYSEKSVRPDFSESVTRSSDFRTLQSLRSASRMHISSCIACKLRGRRRSCFRVLCGVLTPSGSCSRFRQDASVLAGLWAGAACREIQACPPPRSAGIALTCEGRSHTFLRESHTEWAISSGG